MKENNNNSLELEEEKGIVFSIIKQRQCFQYRTEFYI